MMWKEGGTIQKPMTKSNSSSSSNDSSKSNDSDGINAKSGNMNVKNGGNMFSSSSSLNIHHLGGWYTTKQS